jgi:nucleoredoxin
MALSEKPLVERKLVHQARRMRTILASVTVFLAMSGVTSALRAENVVAPALKGALVQSKGRTFSKFDETQLQNTQYYAIYYSAAWCGPCRAFTPDLVKWYDRNKSRNPHFELIFVSSDRSEDAMAAYMKEDDMQWPALAFDKKKSTPELTKYSGRGIPCLVLIDNTGKVISHSYEGTTYVGPRKVLTDIEKTLKENPPDAAATAAAAAAKSGAKPSALDALKKPAAQ